MLNRLKQYIDSKQITISAFERSIGMSNASFGKSLKNGGAIGSDKLENILRTYPEINPTWLLTGKGEMLLIGPETNVVSEPVVAYGIKKEAKQLIPAPGADIFMYLREKDDKIEALLRENERLRQQNELLIQQYDTQKKSLTEALQLLQEAKKVS